MKRSLVLSFLAGVVAGGLLVAFLVGAHYNRMLDDHYVMGVQEQVYVAHALDSRESRARLLDTIESDLPSYVEVLQGWSDREKALSGLWSIQDYYEHSTLEPPPEVAPILDALPPAPPSACLRKPPAPTEAGAGDAEV